MVTSFGWRRFEGSQSPSFCSSCNVGEKREEGEIAGDTGMAMEEEGMLFLRSLGGGKY